MGVALFLRFIQHRDNLIVERVKGSVRIDVGRNVDAQFLGHGLVINQACYKRIILVGGKTVNMIADGCCGPQEIRKGFHGLRRIFLQVILNGLGGAQRDCVRIGRMHGGGKIDVHLVSGCQHGVQLGGVGAVIVGVELNVDSGVFRQITIDFPEYLLRYFGAVFLISGQVPGDGDNFIAGRFSGGAAVLGCRRAVGGSRAVPAAGSAAGECRSGHNGGHQKCECFASFHCCTSMVKINFRLSTHENAWETETFFVTI